MAITKAKRAKMENLIYDTFKALDPTGVNEKKYRAMFHGMTDNEFDRFFKDLFANEDRYLILDVVEYERPLTIENVQKALKVLGVPEAELVAMPFVNKDTDNPTVTKQPVIVGYLHLKRMQQMVSKKNTTSTDIGERSALTGQVSGHDKNARISDSESYGLVTIGADNALKEFMGPRSDDKVMKSRMYSEIAKKGYVSIDELPSSPFNKTSLNTVDVYMIGMGIKSDLVTKGLVVKRTLEKD